MIFILNFIASKIQWNGIRYTVLVVSTTMTTIRSWRLYCLIFSVCCIWYTWRICTYFWSAKTKWIKKIESKRKKNKNNSKGNRFCHFVVTPLLLLTWIFLSIWFETNLFWIPTWKFNAELQNYNKSRQNKPKRSKE